MSMIFPASGKTFNWSPELKKQAQSEGAEVIIADPLMDALNNLPGEDAAPCEECAAELPVEKELPVEQTVEQAVEKAESALDTAVQAVQEIKQEVAPVSEKLDEIPPKEIADEIEIEIVDDNEKEEEGEKEIEIEVKNDESKDDSKDVSEEKEEPKSEDDGEKKDKEEKPTFEKETCGSKCAHDFGGFIHIAKLSKQNKKDLDNYWKNMLGFPSEYVDAMLKDYEA